MNSFEFWSPTKVIFGEDTVNKIGNEVKNFGGRRALIIYGGGSVVESGLLDNVKASLDAADVEYFCVGGVQPNPLVEFAQEIADGHSDKDIDFLIGIGGGSAIDTAKVVAHGIANPNVQIWDIVTSKVPLTKSLPIGVVLTIAAAGSETSNSSVVTNAQSGIKRGFGTQFNRPKFAIMDPVLTYTTPVRHTISGVVDIMMHTLDRYFAPDNDNSLTDAIAEALLRVVIENGKLVVDDPKSYKARSELFWAGSLSHNGLTGLGQTPDMAVHQLGHALSAKYDIPHGESLSIAWPAWAKYVYKTDIGRFAQYARNVWNVTESDYETAAKMGIDATVNYFKSIGAPVKLTELVENVTDDDFNELTYICTYHKTRTIGTFKLLDANDILSTYKMMR